MTDEQAAELADAQRAIDELAGQPLPLDFGKRLKRLADAKQAAGIVEQ